VAAESSYQRFLARAHGLPLEERPTGSAPNAEELLTAAVKLCGHPVDLVAIDMPLALAPIVGRRASDNAVSEAYGARKCGTHTPSANRPGLISDDLRSAFEAAGYPLLTRVVRPPGVIEVYPHPALVELASAGERLCYKASKVGSYWPSDTPERLRPRRRGTVIREWWVPRERTGKRIR
jgi:hypothetical protein